MVGCGKLEDDQTKNCRICSKLVADIEVKSSTASGVLILLNGDAVVDADWSDGKVEADTDSRVTIGGAEQIISGGVDGTDIEEDGGADLIDYWHSDFHGGAPEGLATDGIAVGVFGTDFAELETPEVVGTAEVETVVNGNFGAGFVGGNKSYLSDESEDGIKGKEEVLGSFHAETVGIGVAT